MDAEVAPAVARHLLMAVHLHPDGMGTARYHGMHQGAPEWPPAPARIFQALVAGVARGERLPDAMLPALQWLEQLPPPVIAAPQRRVGQAVSLYVPNNDADALSNPADVSGIRTAKLVQPSLFDGHQPLLFAWPMATCDATDTGQAMADAAVVRLTEAAESLYQLGRGVDMAWADARVVSDDELRPLLQHYRGAVHQPASGTTAAPLLACPAAGSLDSLVQRHRATRLRAEGQGRKSRVLFTNAPKPRFAAISYAPVRRLALYDLRERGSTRAWPWPLRHAAGLAEQLRHAAAQRLRDALPEATDAIERCVLGRTADGSGTVALVQRLQIVPLPSIGAAHTDASIRRVLVEVPADSPLSAADVDWAFSGLERIDPDTGELSPWQLTKADRLDMQAHYSGPSRHWQSVTAVVLPQASARRRIDPARQQADGKPAMERQAEQARAEATVLQALRHAGVSAAAVQVRVQREPFTGQGQRAETFADGTRFAKERLWHVAIAFDRQVAGPLVLGDGRFVGLGVMAPTARASGSFDDAAAWTDGQSDGVWVLQRDTGEQSPTPPDEPLALARAMRRAVMSRVRDAGDQPGSTSVNPYFSGHATDSEAPDRRPSHHLAYHWDAPRDRWLVLAPHRLQHRPAYGWERRHMALLDLALEDMAELRAGTAGRHVVRQLTASAADPALAPAVEWESVTPFIATRHRRLASAQAALVADVLAECARCHLPTPEVTVLDLQSVAGQGLQGRLRLRFASAVAGPLALGRSSLLGGGLFVAVKCAPGDTQRQPSTSP